MSLDNSTIWADDIELQQQLDQIRQSRILLSNDILQSILDVVCSPDSYGPFTANARRAVIVEPSWHGG